MAAYLRPVAVRAALDALAEGPPGGAQWVIVAGATDHYPARVGRMPDEDVLDVSAIGGLRDMAEIHGGWWIGALTTWSDLVEAELPPLFDGLKQAGRAIGGVQIQARGTIAGNVCNASPAADGTPNLLALDAEVELASARGVRRVPLAAFVIGNRRTVRQPDELVTGIFVPQPPPGVTVRSAFEKLGSRAYLVISIAMVAAVVETSPDGLIARTRVAVGACSEVAQRLPALEAALVGRRADRASVALIQPEHLASLTPIDDIRGTSAYRRDAALTAVRRAFGRALS